jgi:hypothetical protein
MELGVLAAMYRMSDLPSDGSDEGLIVLTHHVAWDLPEAGRLLEFVVSGGTLLLDASSGRKTYDASLHRPWPRGLADPLGFRCMGLQSRPEGYMFHRLGTPCGKLLLTRAELAFDEDAGWACWKELRFQLNDEPLVWERSYGKGR